MISVLALALMAALHGVPNSPVQSHQVCAANAAELAVPSPVPTIWNCSATAAQGNNHGTVSCSGGGTVTEVKKNNVILTEGVDYEMEQGTQGSSSPDIKFTNPLRAGDTIHVTGSSPQSDPNPTLALSTVP